jgi:SAM-dependent methyltransferase
MADTQSWWQCFFEGPFEELQVEDVRPDVGPEEVEWISRYLDLPDGARVLDAPCGPGRQSIGLALRGHRVTGIDFNPRVIDASRSAAERHGVSLDLRVADMRTLELKGGYHAALCLGGSVGYFDEAGDLAAARSAFAALEPGGRYLMDLHCAETLYPKYQPRGWSSWGEAPNVIRVLEERTWDLENGRLDTTFTFMRGTDLTERVSSLRIYTYRELCRLLREAGFVHFDAYGGKAREPFGVGSPRLFLVAHKAAG